MLFTPPPSSSTAGMHPSDFQTPLFQPPQISPSKMLLLSEIPIQLSPVSMHNEPILSHSAVSTPIRRDRSPRVNTLFHGLPHQHTFLPVLHSSIVHCLFC